MSRTSQPKLRCKKSHGTKYAVVTLTDGVGGRKDKVLGRWIGKNGGKEANEAYHRVLAEWTASGNTFRERADKSLLSVAELMLRFRTHCESYYRKPDGTMSKEIEDFALSLRLVRVLYGATAAADFGPLALKTVRAAMLKQPITRHAKKRGADGKVIMDADGNPVWEDKVIALGWSRKLVNQRVGRIKAMFRWAISEQLVPKDALCRDLEAVDGLAVGRSEARETDPVLPIGEAVVMDTLPKLLPPVAAMVQVQLLTGCRPGEVCSMRGRDIDMSGAVWLYRPRTHKNQWRESKGDGKYDRTITVGPRAQEVIKPWLRLNVEENLFRPDEAMAAFRADQRANRKSKVQPSQQSRAKRRPKRKPGERYTPRAYASAIARACAKHGIPHWHPHQLRHSAALEATRAAGLDSARAFLGHKKADLTAEYAGRDLKAAVEVAAKIG